MAVQTSRHPAAAMIVDQRRKVIAYLWTINADRNRLRRSWNGAIFDPRHFFDRSCERGHHVGLRCAIGSKLLRRHLLHGRSARGRHLIENQFALWMESHANIIVLATLEKNEPEHCCPGSGDFHLTPRIISRRR